MSDGQTVVVVIDALAQQKKKGKGFRHFSNWKKRYNSTVFEVFMLC